jgi:acetolactate synthase-1/2/3 large subunit
MICSSPYGTGARLFSEYTHSLAADERAEEFYMQSNDTMKGSEAFVKALALEKVKYVFGIPGHGNMHILDAMYGRRDIRFMLTRHEQGAVHIADGYARVSGEAGVCCSSVGAGAANMLMGLGVASGGSSPVLAVNGGIISSMYGKGQLQGTERPENKTDQAYMDVLKPLVKKAWVVERPNLIPEVTHRAIKVAKSGRPGPVAMEIPWDVQNECSEMIFYEPEKHSYGTRIRADRVLTKLAAEKLLAAKFPVIVAGNGVELSGAQKELRMLAERLGAPVVTSLMAKGTLPEDHPLAAGNIGWLGNPVAHEVIREKCDWLLAVGFRFSDESTSFWTEGLPFVKELSIIQIDLIPEEFGRNYPIEIGLLGDAKAVLEDILEIMGAGGNNAKRTERETYLAELRAKVQVTIPHDDRSPVEPIKIAYELQRVLPRNGILVTDTGNHAQYFSAYFRSFGPRRFICPGSWTPMGFAPCAVLGAKIAEPDTVCVCVTGDGGFFMTGQEVITAVEWNTPVVWVVFNNRTLNAIRLGQMDDYGGRIIGTEFTSPADFALMAKSFGAEGIKVTRTSEISGALEAAITCGKPCVVDIETEFNPIAPQAAGDFLTPGKHTPAPRPRGSSL